MKQEAEEILKINVSTYKCKRAKRMVLDELDGSFSNTGKSTYNVSHVTFHAMVLVCLCLDCGALLIN